jgi:hypothetical protein
MRSVRREDGFTLVELLVAAAVSIIIFAATLSILDIYNHESTGVTQRNDAQDLARLGIDRIIQQLRNIASPLTTPKLLERATPYDIVFQTVGTPSGSNTTGAERVRYCIPNDTTTGSAASEVLIGETETWATATPPANPWASTGTLPCPDSPLPASTVQTQVAYAVTNRYQQTTARPAFTFNNGSAPSDLSQINSVQIDLFVNPTPSVASAEMELRSAAYLRNELQPPIANFTYTAQGSGVALLNGGPSYSPAGYDLKYAWSCTTGGGGSCPEAATLAGATDGLVTWQPGAGTYAVTLTVTDPTGLTSTYTQNVTVT